MIRTHSKLGSKAATACCLIVVLFTLVAKAQELETTGLAVVDGRELLAIPVPNLESEEQAVREQLERERAKLDSLLAQQPLIADDLAEAIGTMGELYFLYDLREAAGVCFDNAARLAPEVPRWTYLRSVVETLQGNQREAIKSLREVVEAAPASAAAWIRLGRLYFDLADFSAARSSYREALEHRPKSAAALGGLGIIELRERNWAEAISNLRAALELQPTADSLYYHLGQALRGEGDVAAAREALAKNQSGRLMFDDPWLQQMARYSVTTEGLFHAGNQAMRSNDFGAAATYFEEYVAANPDHVRARYSLALCYLQINRRSEALDVLSGVLVDNPELRGGQRLMADALAEGGDLRASLEFFERAHQQDPEDAPTVADWATVLAKLGRVNEAIAKLAPFVESDANAHYARLKYATILATEGRANDALPMLRDIVDSQGLRKGLRAEALYHIGSLALAAGEREVGIKNLEDALQLDPESALANAALAPLVAGTGDFKRGAALYRVATKSNPLDSRAQFGLAMSLLLSEQDAEAKQALEEGLAILPANDGLRHALARLLASSHDRTVRDGVRAVAIARELLERAPSPEYAQTLAMALAETGDFAQAAALQRQVVERGSGQPGQQQRLVFLQRYEAGQPVRAPWMPTR